MGHARPVSELIGVAWLEGIEMTVYNEANTLNLRGVSELSVLSPIKHGMIPGEIRTYEERLQRVLKSLRDRAANGVPTPIGQIPTIHFARWLIIRPEQYLRHSKIPNFPFYEPEEGTSEDKRKTGSGTSPTLPERKLGRYDPDYVELHPMDTQRKPETVLPSWLLFTSNYDGDLKAYIRAFSSDLAGELDKVWGNCEGYPGGGAADFDAFWDYIKSYQLDTHAFYAAYPDLSTRRVQQLRTFREDFDAFVARTRKADGRSVDNIGALLDEFILIHQAYTSGFPDSGGTYDQRQSSRREAIEKRQR